MARGSRRRGGSLRDGAVVPDLRVMAAVLAAVLIVGSCGGSEPPQIDDGAVQEAAADPRTRPAEGSGDLDVDAWCAEATSTVVMIRYDDPEILAEDIERLERMTALTSGEMRADHEAGLEIRRRVLAVVEELIDPGMDLRERRAAVDGHPRVVEITQTREAQLSESRLMGYHMRHCL
jgi:hypothetical protein